MSAGNHSWLVGSHGYWPSTTVTIEGTPYEIQASQTGLYLYHPTAALNFMAQLEAHLDTELGGTNTVRLNASGKMYIESDVLGGFSLAWTDALGQTFSGFTQGNLSGAGSYTANAVSPWLFMPGRRETPLKGVLGSSGRPVIDVVHGTSRDGSVGAAALGEQIVESLQFQRINKARFQDNSDLDRHFRGWWARVGALRRNFFHYRQVAEDDSSTSAVSWPTGLGPYVCDIEGGEMPGTRSPMGKNVEWQYDLEIPCHIVPEYT
jgi:hypothetical protein